MMREAMDSLVTAIESGRTDIVRSIVSACERCEVEDEGDIAVEQLLNSNISVCGTVLHLATKLGDADIVRTLLSAGADPGIHNDEGQTALDLATSPKVCDVFSQELLQSIAHSNIGRTCQLLAAGVSVNLIDCPDSANTPLHWAACYANADTVQCLIKRKASVNAVNTDGATPLHDAISRGEMFIVEELLKSGASTTLRPHSGKYDGKTVADIAEEDMDLGQLLEKHKNVPLLNGLHEDDIPSKREDHLLMQRSLSENSTASEHLTDSAPSTPKLIKPQAITVHDEKVTDEKETNDVGAESSNGETQLKLLWPPPQQLLRLEGPPCVLTDSLSVYMASSPQKGWFHAGVAIWQLLGEELQSEGVTVEVEPLLQGRLPQDTPHVVSEINPRLFSHQQAYRISIFQFQVKIQASDELGLFYASKTLLQLIRLCKKDGIPQLQIHDWPSVRDRGVLLDLSKGRIPKVDSLLNLVKVLASLKINQVHLYMRFKSLSGNETKWQLPYSQSSLLQLDSACQSHQVELMPVLDVAPSVGYLDLLSLRSSFLAFVQCFPSAGVVGVGPRLTSLVVDTAEEGAFTMDEVGSVLPVSPHQALQMCAYVLHDMPDLLRQLPCGTMLAEYGFEATYDFQKYCQTFTDYGVPFSVIPGTAAWNSLAGCPEAALANISRAVTCAVEHRALGVVVSNWAGVGHMTHLPISWLGFLIAAGLSWNSETPEELLDSSLPELLDHHVFRDAGGVIGHVIIALGRAETDIIRCSRRQAADDYKNMPSEKGSTLYQLLSQPDQVALETLTQEVFQKTMRFIRNCVSQLDNCDLQCAEAEEVIQELRITGDLMLSACRVGRALVHAGRNPKAGHAGYAVVNLGVANLTPTQKTDLANRLLPQLESYRLAWLGRSLPQGLPSSLTVLTTMLKQFIPQGHHHSEGPDDASIVTAS